MDRQKLLSAYLEDISLDTDFWASSHCMLFAGRWVNVVHPNYDVGKWVGVHKDMADAARDIERAGGMVALFEREAASAGLVEIREDVADIGDVGLFEITGLATKLAPYVTASGMPDVLYPSCIRTAHHWAVRGADGVGRVSLEGRHKPIRVWRV